MINGVINIYKEPGFTSFDVVAKLRGILKQKKIGHTGTLDPMAEGVLLVCLGNATKLVDVITSKDKCYRATMLLGQATDTEDVSGNVLEQRNVDVDEISVYEAMMSFVGEYGQIPPMYSAIKKDGKKLYEYARAGIEIEREPRNVHIYSIEDVSYELPYVTFTVRCSKGTYIRSLIRDIGEKLGCLATMSALVRENVHGFDMADSLKLADVERLVKEEKILDYIMPTDSILKNYPAYKVDNESVKYLYNGNKLFANQLNSVTHDNNSINPKEDMIRVYYENKLVALYMKTDEASEYKPYKMFLEN